MEGSGLGITSSNTQSIIHEGDNSIMKIFTLMSSTSSLWSRFIRTLHLSCIVGNVSSISCVTTHNEPSILGWVQTKVSSGEGISAVSHKSITLLEQLAELQQVQTHSFLENAMLNAPRKNSVTWQQPDLRKPASSFLCLNCWNFTTETFFIGTVSKKCTWG